MGQLLRTTCRLEQHDEGDCMISSCCWPSIRDLCMQDSLLSSRADLRIVSSRMHACMHVLSPRDTFGSIYAVLSM